MIFSVGLVALGPGGIDAANNWWGTETGPAAETNPDGEGDLIFGNAVILPFLLAHPSKL